jgi:hypothetical protein
MMAIADIVPRLNVPKFHVLVGNRDIAVLKSVTNFSEYEDEVSDIFEQMAAQTQIEASRFDLFPNHWIMDVAGDGVVSLDAMKIDKAICSRPGIRRAANVYNRKTRIIRAALRNVSARALAGHPRIGRENTPHEIAPV